jgi:hypothetical protein
VGGLGNRKNALVNKVIEDPPSHESSKSSWPLAGATPMGIAYPPYNNGIYEDHVGRTGLEGEKKWRRHVSMSWLASSLRWSSTIR